MTISYATTFADIQTAAETLKHKIHKTPVFTSRILDELTQKSLYFKCEQFQKVGAFKIRGATFAIDQIDTNAKMNGVVTHSSGNHAQAIALAARDASLEAHIVMPSNSPIVKKNAVLDYGAAVYECEPTLDARQTAANALVESLGATLIPPYNHPHVITGQGTLGLEFFEQAPHLDTVLVPVGGGGLCSGVAIAMKHLQPSIKVFGVEPSGADDAFQSLSAGHFIPQTNPQTIADGLRTSLGDLTYPILRDHLDGILTVTETGIVDAMKLIWTRMKTLVEPSAAVTLAAVLEHDERLKDSKHLGLVLTGGNVDLTCLPW